MEAEGAGPGAGPAATKTALTDAEREVGISAR